MKDETTKPKRTGLAVRKFGMIHHFNMEDKNILTYGGYLDYPGHALDGKQVFKTTVTPKIDPNPSGLCKFGKPEHSYTVDDGTPEPPLFTSIILLMDFYKLTPVTR